MLLKYKNRGKCAFLTISDLSEFECYDHLLIEPMKDNGWELSFLPWDEKDIDWNDWSIENSCILDPRTWPKSK